MKQVVLTSVFAFVVGASAVVMPKRAEACGGCFVPESESTQVTGHRMAMSISQDQTTLYDQITYSGSPEEFAWILPIRGQVEIGLSSDALFQVFQAMTEVTVVPPADCPAPETCQDDYYGGAGPGPGPSVGGGGTGGAPPVEILAAEVVGPYETVQLSSDDPNALIDWLTLKGYAIPEEVEPLIDDYVAEGFDFLALRLVPGNGIDSMRPIRITTPGASPELPLRMVAAGTGAKTIVNLWVIAEGRYEPQNFPSFKISQTELTWDWTSDRSDYAEIRANKFQEANGFAWYAAAAESVAYESSSLESLFTVVPTGYGDVVGVGAFEEAQADRDVLFHGLDPASFWISRLDAELTRPALGTDLLLEASIPQEKIDRRLQVKTECPPLPPPPDCGDGGNGGSSGSSSSTSGSADDGCRSSSGEVVSSRSLVAVLAGLGLAALRRRRRPRCTSVTS